MSSVAALFEKMQNNSVGIWLADLCKICDHYFGQPRQAGGSHQVYKITGAGDPRVTIQNNKGYAKVYQIKQIFEAIDRLETEHGTK